MNEPLLKINDLETGYRGRMVLSNISMNVEKGERIAVIGPNGCGKSTLLRAITSEIVSSKGEIKFKGQSLEGKQTESIIGMGIGYLRQTRNFFPGLTVSENLELASRDGNRDMREALEKFPSLRNLQSTRAGLLSGGERQALAVAMAFAKQSEMLLLDEPLSGLSQKNAEAMLGCISKFQSERGCAFLMVEHRLQIIEPHVDRVILLLNDRKEVDTRNTEILLSRQALEEHYKL